MKHYIKDSGYEYDAFARYISVKPRHLAEVKRSYRRRERAALNRELAREIAESDEGATTAELAYLERRMDAEFAESEAIAETIGWLYEIGEEPSRLLLSANEAAWKRADKAYDEWWNAA